MGEVKHYLRLDGIEGESTDPGHKGWIDVLSFEFFRYTSEARGMAKLGQLGCICHSGKQSPPLFHLHHGGLPVPKGVLECFEETRGKPSLLFRARFPRIEGVQFQPRGTLDDRPLEGYLFDVAEVVTEYGFVPHISQSVRPRHSGELRRGF
ncbi:MAG: type VI secretion system tube protein Hcp [Gemmataceae bacterium]